jgi:hypothetical protein
MDDPVNHPTHYTAYQGLEVIDLTEQMNFNRGNAVKYLCRAGLKDPDNEIQDLEKAAWYINREIQRLYKLAHDRELELQTGLVPAKDVRAGLGIEGGDASSAKPPSTTGT